MCLSLSSSAAGQPVHSKAEQYDLSTMRAMRRGPATLQPAVWGLQSEQSQKRAHLQLTALFK